MVVCLDMLHSVEQLDTDIYYLPPSLRHTQARTMHNWPSWVSKLWQFVHYFSYILQLYHCVVSQ